MARLERNTETRGRSAVPLMRPRMRRLRRARASLMLVALILWSFLFSQAAL